jgi:hypothetical protein
MLTFQQGTKLIIDNGIDRYELLIGSGTASQTFLETTQKIKTLHAPNLIERSFSNEKGAVNLSFMCQLSTDSVLMEWFGFDASGSNHQIDPLYNTLRGYDVYIQAPGTIYRLSGCIGQNISFSLSRTGILQANITGLAASIDMVGSVPTTGSLVPQTDFYNAAIVIPGFENLVSVTCEITRNITWAGKKSIFDIGSIYTPKNAVLDSMAISGSITQNKIDDTDTDNAEDFPVQIQYGSSFEINLASCNSTSRWDMGAIHKRVTDYKLQPTAGNSYIKF